MIANAHATRWQPLVVVINGLHGTGIFIRAMRRCIEGSTTSIAPSTLSSYALDCTLGAQVDLATFQCKSALKLEAGICKNGADACVLRRIAAIKFNKNDREASGIYRL